MSVEARDVRLERRPWGRAFWWLAFLAPFFYLTYGVANAMAADRADLGSIVFAWEDGIPFLGWTIIPYWSINAFYALSLFVCATKTELRVHVRRLITAQVIAVTCFILFPLEFSFQRPPAGGLSAFLFAALASFDKPFNQAPSLHIALLIILWPHFIKHLPRQARWPLHIWFALVGVSVLTTFQHHFVDIPTGALLGFVCLWLWPDHGGSPLERLALATDGRRLILATAYLVAADVMVAIAWFAGGWGLWLLWPAVSLLLVAANYAVIGPRGFQKDANGRMTLAARVLLAPYLMGAFLNSRSWTRREPDAVTIGDGVWLGRIPRPRDAARFAAVVDLCAELPGGSPANSWTCIPMLDLVAPPPAQLRDAAASIERARSKGPVLVCCALGYTRSAASVATWLISKHPTRSTRAAIDQIRRVRPRIAIDPALCAAIVTATGRGA